MRFCLAALAVAALGLPLAACCGADTYFVAPDGSGDFATIQAALNAAGDGDVVILADGVFHGAGNHTLRFLGKAVTLRSQSDDPRNCILDVGGTPQRPLRGFNLDNAEGPGTVIRGLTVANAVAPGG